MDSINGSILKGCTSLETLSVPFIGSSIDFERYRFLSYFFGGTSYNQNKDLVPETLKHIFITSPEVKVIWNEIFYNVKNLESITLTNNITHIYSAFANTALKDIYFEGTKEEWNSILNYDTYVTSATKHFYSESEPTDTTNSYWHYDENGKIAIW